MANRMPPPAMIPTSDESHPRGQETARHQPDRDTWKRNHVGQDAMPEIDGKQHDECAPEDEAYSQQPGRPVYQSASGEQHRRGQFDQRVHRGDPGTTCPAAAAKQEPAQDRYVLVPGQMPPTFGATRRRPDDRFASRHPIDTDVEKAAHQQAGHGENKCERECRHRSWAGPVGKGLSGDSGPSPTTPDSRLYGMPAGSTGTPGR